MKYLICFFIVGLILSSCQMDVPPEDIPEEVIESAETVEIEEPAEIVIITFEEVSRPYLDEYGEAESVTEYISGDYHIIDWWWWTQGFEVSFINSPYDYTHGWRVDSTYSFEPIL